MDPSGSFREPIYFIFFLKGMLDVPVVISAISNM